MMQKPDIWKRIDSTEIADCRIFKIREDICERAGDNTSHNFFVIENPDWVNIIALTKDGDVVLINQFRHGTEEIILEIPGGMIDEGEEPETAARRELVEETGYEAAEFVYLGKSRPNPAIQNNTIYHFLAKDCVKVKETSFDEHESVVTCIVPYENVKKLILSGEITHALAVAGFYYSDLYLNSL